MRRTDKFGVIADFLSPFEDNLQVVLVGDEIPKPEINKVCKGIDKARQDWFSLPDITDKYVPATCSTMSVSDVYHGKMEALVVNKPSIIYLDREMSYKTLMVITGRTESLDKVDVMLIRRYLVDVILNKIIFDITDIDPGVMELITFAMDHHDQPYHYFISGKYMGLWLFFKNS